MIDEKKLNRDDLCDICRSADCANCFSDKDFEKWIDMQPKLNAWIPVSERLPEYDEFVLVTANGKHNNITFEHAIELAVYAKDKVYAKDEGWILEAYPDWLEPNVTAWMPLPEPYKEQNDDI